MSQDRDLYLEVFGLSLPIDNQPHVPSIGKKYGCAYNNSMMNEWLFKTGSFIYVFGSLISAIEIFSCVPDLKRSCSDFYYAHALFELNEYDQIIQLIDVLDLSTDILEQMGQDKHLRDLIKDLCMVCGDVPPLDR